MNAEEVKKYLDYNEETGIFKWKIRTSNRIKVGDEAGVINKLGYRIVSLNGKKEYCHRLAWVVMHGEVPDCIDHINGNKLDNRISNLRNTTKAINNMNQHVSRSALKLGVYNYRSSNSENKFKACIQENGKLLHLGVFKTEDDAFNAYKSYREKRGI
jgi:hypothetical protein